jgi:hypothetical protein
MKVDCSYPFPSKINYFETANQATNSKKKCQKKNKNKQNPTPTHPPFSFSFWLKEKRKKNKKTKKKVGPFRSIKHIQHWFFSLPFYPPKSWQRGWHVSGKAWMTFVSLSSFKYKLCKHCNKKKYIHTFRR